VERGASRNVVGGAGRADTDPPGASGVVRSREDCLERQIAFQKGVIQAIALTGRFGEMPAAQHRLHRLESELFGLRRKSGRSRRT
jgi:hypothetical protein